MRRSVGAGLKLRVAELTALFGHRAFLLLYLGGAISQLGSNMTRIALPILILQRTNSLAAAGLGLALQLLPIALVGPFGGAVADRWGRKPVLIATDALRALLTGALLVVTEPFGLSALILAVGILGALHFPARSASLPEVVAPNQFPAAVALGGVTVQSTELLAPFLAAVALAWIGPEPILLFDAATFAISAALTIAAVIPTPLATSRLTLAGDVTEAISKLLSNVPLRGVISLRAVLAIPLAALQVVLLLYITDKLVLDSAFYGLPLGLFSAGTLLGSALAPLAMSHRHHLRWANAAAAVVGLELMTFAVSPGYTAVLLLATIAGLMFGVFNMMASVWIGRLTPRALRARTYALSNAASALAYAAGALLVGGLAQSIGPSATMVVIGGATVIGTIATSRWSPLASVPEASEPIA
ncbi:MAG: MFS transporter [Candidatus Limnocylindria bacterium]